MDGDYPASRWRLQALFGSIWFDGELNGKDIPIIGPAAGRDRATMSFDDLLGQGQVHAGVFGGTFAGAVEWLKYK